MNTRISFVCWTRQRLFCLVEMFDIKCLNRFKNKGNASLDNYMSEKLQKDTKKIHTYLKYSFPSIIIAPKLQTTNSYIKKMLQ